jgi:asparagine synthase (glutamine-hydrolysing)
MYPNMEHVVLRSAGLSPLHVLRRDGPLFQQPLGNACNHTWWSAVSEAVSDRGISILLTGENGNLTISAGGLSTLADFIRTGRWIGWWREAAASVGGAAGPSWRGVLASSFLPWLPQRAWLSLSRLRSARARNPGGISLLRPEWQAEVEPIVSAYQHGGRPDKDSRRSRWRIMQRADAGNLRKGALGRWGIDERDPTSDRRLAEFCFSLPPDQLLGGGINRRLARMALSDRLPRSVLHGPRGYQYADWYRDIDRAGVEREIARLEEKLRDSSIVDLERLRAVASSWPTGGWAAFDVIQTYRMSLLHALAAAEFQSGSCQSGVQQSLGIGGVAGSPAKP